MPPGLGYPRRFVDFTGNIIIDDEADHSVSHTSWYWYIADSMLPSPPYTTANNIWVGDTTVNFFQFVDPLGVTPPVPTGEFVQGATDQIFNSRAAAGLTQPFPIPAACTDQIGNVSVP